jgi:hypothetical protein
MMWSYLRHLLSLDSEVAVDDLDHPLGILELHLLLIALMGNLLLTFPLAGRHAVVAQLLLLLLMELLRELLDLPALLGIVVHGVVHRAPWPTLITVGGLVWPLVASWTMTPNSRCSSNSGNGRSGHQLAVVIADGLLLPVFVFAAALSSSICFGLAGLPCLWSR